MRQWICRKIIRGYGAADQDRAGVVLVTCLVFIGVLMLISAALAAVVMPEMRATRHHRQKRESFYQAEAVAQYTLVHINQGLRDGTLDLSGDVVTVDFGLPEGIEGDPVTELRRLANNEWYTFAATGRSNHSASVIEVAVRRPSLFSCGLFGDEEVTLMPNYEVFSFDSRLTINPQESDSTGEATVGVNGALTVQNGVFVHGLFLLGETLGGTSPTPPTDFHSIRVDRIDPDPLGMHGGMLESAFDHYSKPEHNDNASAGIVNNSVVFKGSGGTLNLTGGSYYLENVDISGPNSRINVNASPGNPVVIYVDGDFFVQNRTQINYGEGCGPADLIIYSKSSNQMKINPNAKFQGMIYAPYAEVWVNPGGGLYGVIWAGSARLQPNGTLFVDTAILDRYRADYVVVEQWNQKL